MAQICVDDDTDLCHDYLARICVQLWRKCEHDMKESKRAKISSVYYVLEITVVPACEK